MASPDQVSAAWAAYHNMYQRIRCGVRTVDGLVVHTVIVSSDVGSSVIDAGTPAQAERVRYDLMMGAALDAVAEQGKTT